MQLIYNQDGGVGGDGLQDGVPSTWMLSDADKETRSSAAMALHNLVFNNADERKVGLPFLSLLAGSHFFYLV